jgi:hypothetical protein
MPKLAYLDCQTNYIFKTISRVKILQVLQKELYMVQEETTKKCIDPSFKIVSFIRGINIRILWFHYPLGRRE